MPTAGPPSSRALDAHPLKPLALSCPACAGALTRVDAGRLACAACELELGRTHGAWDLSLGAATADGWPVGRAALERALARRDAGLPWKAALEALLLEQDEDAADRTMQLLRESRGAWLPLVAARGRALLVGNALSGTAQALAACGFEVTLCEPDPLRLGLALFRAEALAPGSTRAVVLGAGRRLPFSASSFELVVREGWSAGGDAQGDLRECQRVGSGELALIAQNRLAYKTSDLRRGRFQVPGALEFAARALRPTGGLRTLVGYRRLLGAGSRAFALYPHSDDFSHVVGLEEGGPRLTIGPKERKNRLKLLAKGAGLFPVLTPSFLLLAPDRREDARLELALDRLAERTGEPRPRVDQLVATRGQTAVVMTSVPGAREDDPAGRWCLHVPLCPAQVVQVERHMRTLERLRAEHPAVPVPEPLFVGELEGLWLSCERRLPGMTAPHLTGELEPTRALYADAVRHLNELVLEPAAPCDEQLFERLLGARFELVRRHAAVDSTVRKLQELRERARAALLGRRLPIVLMHQDLRSKHVQVDPGGRVLGYLDWGTADDCGVPGFDLLHLIVHERKQEAGLGAGEAWRIVREGTELRPHERAALEQHTAAIGLDQDLMALFADCYPVLVAAMAEANWDYSRPRWMHRQFGL